MQRIRTGLHVEYFTVAWMIFEVAGSFAAAILAWSLALIAFGSDSLIELASSLLVLRHLRKDSTGSVAVERRIAKMASWLLLAVIPAIALTSAYSYFLRIQPESSILGLIVAVGAVIVMPILWMEKKRIGYETNCLPLSIDALESATCFLISLALLASIVIIFFFNLWWVDYLATAIILGIIGKEAIESYHEAHRQESFGDSSNPDYYDADLHNWT